MGDMADYYTDKEVDKHLRHDHMVKYGNTRAVYLNTKITKYDMKQFELAHKIQILVYNSPKDKIHGVIAQYLIWGDCASPRLIEEFVRNKILSRVYEDRIEL